MNSLRRIRDILIGALMIVSCFIMIMLPDLGYILITLILGLGLAIYGIRKIVYYFTMARHMVGGKSTFFIGLIALDMGVFALSLTAIPQFFIMLYLKVVFGTSGSINLVSGLSAKKNGAMHWRGKVAHGLICIGLMIVCFVFTRETLITVWIYSFCLAYAGIKRIIDAFRRTSIVYIQ